MKMARRDFLNVSTAAAVVCATALLPVEKAAAAQQTMAAQELLEQAYLYAFPLVLMDATRKVSTHTETPNSTRAPINQFCHAEKLADAAIETQTVLWMSQFPMRCRKTRRTGFPSERLNSISSCVSISPTGMP